MDVTIVSSGLYTYCIMLIGGMLRDAGHQVTLTRTPRRLARITCSCSACSRPGT